MDAYSNLGGPEEGEDSVVSGGAEERRFPEEEVEDGLDGARYSYLFNFFGVPFCLLPLIRRDNAFSLLHAKQATVVWILFFGSLGIGWSFLWLSVHALWIWIVVGGAGIALNVLGYQRVLDEKSDPLPLAGPLAERWFRNLSLREDGALED